MHSVDGMLGAMHVLLELHGRVGKHCINTTDLASGLCESGTTSVVEGY
jgi:hypothetical protein